MDNQEKQIPLNTMSNNNFLTQKIIVCFEGGTPFPSLAKSVTINE